MFVACHDLWPLSSFHPWEWDDGKLPFVKDFAELTAAVCFSGSVAAVTVDSSTAVVAVVAKRAGSNVARPIACINKAPKEDWITETVSERTGVDEPWPA